jgi:hypothetical protein
MDKLDDPGINGRIIFKCSGEKEEGLFWTGYICLGIETSVVPSRAGNVLNS